jgi:hypothetical protein
MNRVFHEIADVLRRYYFSHTVCTLDKLHVEVVDNSNTKLSFQSCLSNRRLGSKSPWQLISPPTSIARINCTRNNKHFQLNIIFISDTFVHQQVESQTQRCNVFKNKCTVVLFLSHARLRTYVNIITGHLSTKLCIRTGWKVSYQTISTTVAIKT